MTRENRLMEKLKEKYNFNFNEDKSLLENLNIFLDKKKDSLEEFKARKEIKKTLLKKIISKKEKVKLEEIGFVEEKLICFIIDKEKKTSVENIEDEDFIRSYFLLRIENKKIEFIGNRRTLKKILNSNGSIVEDFRSKCKIKEKELIKNIFSVEKNTKYKIQIYYFQLNGSDFGKKIRIKFYSDKTELIKKFEKNYLKNEKIFKAKSLKDLKLENLISINFKNMESKKAKLKITRLYACEYLLKWSGDPKLIEELAVQFKIPKKESSLRTSMSHIELLNQFFKKDRIGYYEKTFIFKEILETYKDVLELGNNNQPKIKKRGLIKKIIEVLGKQYKIENINVLRKNKNIYFPTNQEKNKGIVLRFKKNKKIFQHLIINHNLSYDIGKERTYEQFFMFIPYFILDFREKKDEGKNDFILNTGKFIFNIYNNKEEIIKNINNENNKIENYIDSYFKVAKKILSEINKFKLNIKSKGNLFEQLCFCILSKILLTQKLGGREEEDGLFFIEDERIAYDAKYLTPNNKTNVLLKSIYTKRRIKDIRYIKKRNVSNYVFILKDLSDENFKKVKNKIEEKTNCVVSGITITALKNLVELCEDMREISKTKLKSAICSGSLKRNFTKEEVLENDG